MSKDMDWSWIDTWCLIPGAYMFIGMALTHYVSPLAAGAGLGAVYLLRNRSRR